ncbi:recombination-associated protein RdgC [uncultured Thiodictyon sp.]|uniref:recombination-associated protein RdgC n=1 Tax=uncultured Thiodictyon sp. TaxID=1846217 RepID=UPI0025D9861F|nr:recombination-associated protein RdgC [uncultured Thiodictyon sp.]
MFKNARMYRLGTPFVLPAADLEEALGTRRFRPCGPVEVATLGWSAPLGDETSGLVHGVGGCLLLCLRKQERLLPSAAVAEAVDERIAEIETSEARDVGRSERRSLREQIVTEMLPRAFTRSRRTLFYIDTESGWLVVDAASEKTAEEAISLLRVTLETLPAKPTTPRQAPAGILTAWLLAGDAPADFVPADACELRDAEDSGSVIRCKGQDLSSDEILNHLRAGKQVVKLALDWDERLSFVLADDLSLKRLKVGDALLDEIDEQDDPAARLDAEFALMALQLRELFVRLDTVFGLIGEEGGAKAVTGTVPPPWE